MHQESVVGLLAARGYGILLACVGLVTLILYLIGRRTVYGCFVASAQNVGSVLALPMSIWAMCWGWLARAHILATRVLWNEMRGNKGRCTTSEFGHIFGGEWDSAEERTRSPYHSDNCSTALHALCTDPTNDTVVFFIWGDILPSCRISYHISRRISP